MTGVAEKYNEYETKKPVFLRDLPWGGFTYNDYMSWDENPLLELTDGIPYMMAPPVIWHQEIAGEIFIQLKEFLKNKPCKAFMAPVGVRLFPEDNGEDKDIVIPDVVVVCDEKKLADGKTINGSPDFVIEVISPSSKGRDLIDKKELYEAAQVKEYWVVDKEKIYKYVLENNAYKETIYETAKGLAVEVNVLKGCVIRF